MNPEFTNILMQAGEWASSLSLQQASLNKEAGRLDIHLLAPFLPSYEQQQTLDELFQNRFSSFETCVHISRPPREQAQRPLQKDKREQAGKPVNKQEDKLILGKRIAQYQLTAMQDLREDSGRVTIEGHPLEIELRALSKSPDRVICILAVTDYSNTVQCKAFLDKKEANVLQKHIEAAVKEGACVRLRGDCEYDKFSHDLVIRMEDVLLLPGVVRQDNSEQKRVELHLHTTMSAMDALTSVTDAVKRAAKWGHSAVAITDHGVAQAFPEAARAGIKNNIKILFGVEAYLKHDAEFIPMDGNFVVFDLETTGLKTEQSHIIEIGAVKLSGGKIIDRFSTFVDAGVPVPQNIFELTGISDDMLQGAPHVREALRCFAEFAKDNVLVAHNAAFDVGFIRVHGGRYGISFDQPYVDTLMLSRNLLFGMQNHKLGTICEYLNITLENHHRAVDDAQATAEAFLKFLERIRALGKDKLPAITKEIERENQEKRTKRYHAVLLAKTQAGLKNLYRLISHSHLDYFHKKPLMPKSLLYLHRDGLLVGSACEQGEIIQGLLNGCGDEEMRALAALYDYLEIQPIGNNEFLVRENRIADEDGLRDLNRRVVKLGEELGKPVVATGDVHFLDPEDAIFRAILMHKEGYRDADLQAPLYFKTTDEMLEEFAYLGEEKALEVVVAAPNAIADLCEKLKPYPEGTFAPKLENAEEELREMALTRAYELYGNPLPPVVQARMDKELSSIINNGFASLYLVAQKLVRKSLQDGYLVGSRGSVGSSLVATMLGITEVNALQPHYVCPACLHSDFDVDRAKYACGVDMPAASCSQCGQPYRKEGFDIPFEVFLGFNGDKTPDIDLNFSGEYQAVAHKFTEEMFGYGHAFRAGTISSVQEKTAYGYVRSFLESKNKTVSRLEMDRLCKGCSGVKYTTGQHPGGIVIVPKDTDILEFTPVQYPSDQKEKGTITTHFDFHALDDRLVKLDILGHVDPTALRMLQDMTGLDPRSIPLDDPETLSLYSNTDSLCADLSAITNSDVGSLGLPEFGTSFVRQMLVDTRPTTIEELVRIAGLSHGTDVWLNNAQTLVAEGVATLSEVICTRDDIMNYLIACGCDPSMSFKTMENVRKGKGLTPEMKAEMQCHDVPAWYIESCEKIKYMFPRAHAVAYVMMSFRIAYYKMHYPQAFYAVYFTTRADVFDVRYAMGGAGNVLKEIKAIRNKGKDASAVETKMLTILEVVYEMNMRGIELLPVDIYHSHAKKFLIENGAIRAPFSAIAGIGDTAAMDIANSITGEKFVSMEDFQIKTGANSAAMEAMEEAGCFKSFPKTDQVSMFDAMNM